MGGILLKLYIVGIGPGNYENMTVRADRALQESQVIVGYPVYVDLVKDRYPDRQYLSTAMTQEAERCRMAIEEAEKGKTVSIRCTDAKLPAGQYFDAELEGCTVLDDATGETLGKLDKVLHYPAHKVYQVRGGAHEYLIPAVPGVFIAAMDPDAETIRVHMMKGLATDEN